MSDRCYMEITCRREDVGRFETLGFTAQKSDNSASPLVVMVDDEANYAHYDKLPTDIPYLGFNGAGSEYGPGNLVCDGKVCAEVDVGQGGGFVVDWDEARNRPFARSLKAIRHYLKTRKNVTEMFARAQPT